MITLKNAHEIRAMSEACRISAQALKVAGEYMQPGVSTKEIDDAIRKYIVSTGAKPNFLGYGGFPASACISINNEVIHGIPSKKRILHEGDIVSVDVGAFYNDFNGDNAYTFAVGEISDEAKQLLRVTEECLYKAIEVAKPGNRIGDIGHAVQSHAESFGYGVVRKFVGHGVGRKLHEDPEVPNFGNPGRGVRLAAGMTLAIEPMINLVGADVRVLSDGWTTVTASGSIAAHFEHSIVITDEGARILTRA
ncbi:Methionine aminopeptidase 1 [uncultured Ruminococcus sp.]|uniref:Methionine aminopeptidase n=1 Tax=Massiliimalia timonensis TaxID=1987501 RepID=A0A8J6TX92_9FIRM|nr:type I methionyl aminopeptidase [Massiliimalia timonensis]MBC8610810.1 type I methionyl aminopeptidase [Massiliimalia timonensis]MBS7175910.1 type I methionyl aminopeptidase [Clostridiales bacterium]SCH99604.1 Methionine aminopeptidase 1 [uncultured Clostridium sp.]SCI18985.1 Methionine aminopeptidase 1 [uncultured Ruminococcus sp.]